MTTRRTKKRKAPSRAVMERTALANALADRSCANYDEIINGFAAMGIAVEDITPRENVFTYHAWRALGRQVRRGAHGVQIVTWIERKSATADGATAGPGEGTQPEEQKAKPPRMARNVTVFHVSQTDPIEQTVDQAAATRGAEPEIAVPS